MDPSHEHVTAQDFSDLRKRRALLLDEFVFIFHFDEEAISGIAEHEQIGIAATRVS